MGTRHTLPPALADLVQGYRWTRIANGESGAEVYRLAARSKPPLIIKYVPCDIALDLKDEAARLRWLAGRTSVPAVQALAADEEAQWLLMTALPGRNAEASPLRASVKIRVIAEALRDLHAIDAGNCPFDERLDTKIARAAEAVQEGRVDEDAFDEANLGHSAADLFSLLLSKRPASEDLVVTHGDACFDNFILDGSTFSGFIDCTRAGVADRYQDLALACRSIEYDLGPRWIVPFLHHYGLDAVDTERLAFYRLLDEFS